MTKFCYGAAFSLCLLCMWQDLIGKDAYIQHVQDHWVNSPWWVFFLLAVVLVIVARKSETRD